MALDRQSIEKQDFPVGRRGYDPEAVDAHLKQIAEEVEELKRSGGGAGGSLAASAGRQVSAIVEAAEATAAQIRSDAERDSRKILADARRELKKAQDDAASLAAAEVSKTAQAAASLSERIEAMEQEVSGLMKTLRTGADRLNADLRLLEESLSDLKATVSEPPEADEEVVAVTAVVVEEEPEDEPAAAVTVPDPAPAPEADQGGEGDLEGARLIALNMALNGNSREDVDRYLDQNFDLSDRKALLDEVYASVEG